MLAHLSHEFNKYIFVVFLGNGDRVETKIFALMDLRRRRQIINKVRRRRQIINKEIYNDIVCQIMLSAIEKNNLPKTNKEYVWGGKFAV